MSHTFVGTYRHHDRSGATIVSLSVTTDFAARTTEAQTAADRIAMVAHGCRAVVLADVLTCPHPDGGTVAVVLADLSRTLGEPVSIDGVVRVDREGATTEFKT